MTTFHSIVLGVALLSLAVLPGNAQPSPPVTYPIVIDDPDPSGAPLIDVPSKEPPHKGPHPKEDYPGGAVDKGEEEEHSPESGCLLSALAGFYVRLPNGVFRPTPWHKVSVTPIGPRSLRWRNRAHVRWTLKLLTPGGAVDRSKLAVGEDCPYYRMGHREATIVWSSEGGVKALLGPWGEAYVKVPNDAASLSYAIAGEYVRFGYTGLKQEKKHFVNVTAVDKGQFEWVTLGGEKWGISLRRRDNGYDRNRFRVSPGSPYYTRRTRYGNIYWSEDETKVVALEGPGKERYTRIGGSFY